MPYLWRQGKLSDLWLWRHHNADNYEVGAASGQEGVDGVLDGLVLQVLVVVVAEFMQRLEASLLVQIGIRRELLNRRISSIAEVTHEQSHGEDVYRRSFVLREFWDRDSKHFLDLKQLYEDILVSYLQVRLQECLVGFGGLFPKQILGGLLTVALSVCHLDGFAGPVEYFLVHSWLYHLKFVDINSL